MQSCAVLIGALVLCSLRSSDEEGNCCKPRSCQPQFEFPGIVQELPPPPSYIEDLFEIDGASEELVRPRRKFKGGWRRMRVVRRKRKRKKKGIGEDGQ